MARAPKPPHPPVSDRSVHLWLSAVLGVWCGLLFSLGFQLSYPAIGVWFAVFVVTAPMLAIATMVSVPVGREASDLITLSGILLSLGCAAVTANCGFGLSSGFALVPLRRAIVSLGVAAVLLGGPLIALRFLVPWLILVTGAWVLRPWYGPFVYRPDRCRWCRFDQSGLPEHDLCPECGEAWKLPVSRRQTDVTLQIVRLSRVVVALTGVGVVTSALPHAVMAWHYRGLSIHRGDAYGQSTGWFGSVTSMSYTLKDSENRGVSLVIVEDTEFGTGQLRRWQPVRSRLSGGGAGTPGFPPIHVNGLIPREDVLRALEAQQP